MNRQVNEGERDLDGNVHYDKMLFLKNGTLRGLGEHVRKDLTRPVERSVDGAARHVERISNVTKQTQQSALDLANEHVQRLLNYTLPLKQTVRGSEWGAVRSPRSAWRPRLRHWSIKRVQRTCPLCTLRTRGRMTFRLGALYCHRLRGCAVHGRCLGTTSPVSGTSTLVGGQSHFAGRKNARCGASAHRAQVCRAPCCRTSA